MFNETKRSIYETHAFAKEKWEQFGAGELVAQEDVNEEIASLPDNIHEILFSNCPIYTGSANSIVSTHKLVRMPKGLDLVKLVKIAKAHLPNSGKSGDGLWINRDDLETVERPYWILLTKDIVPESLKYTCLSFEELIKTLPNYEIPSSLEAATGIYANYLETKNDYDPFSGERILSDHQFAACLSKERDNAPMYQLFPDVKVYRKHAVGDFTESGLQICYDSYFNTGIMAVRKF